MSECPKTPDQIYG